MNLLFDLFCFIYFKITSILFQNCDISVFETKLKTNFEFNYFLHLESFNFYLFFINLLLKYHATIEYILISLYLFLYKIKRFFDSFLFNFKCFFLLKQRNVMIPLWFSDLKLESGQEITNEIEYNSTEILFKYPCEGSTECSPYIITLERGIYMFEVWGAQGGGPNMGIDSNFTGGKGGYSKGIVRLKELETFYIYVGSSGEPTTGNGGFNGGGAISDEWWLNGNKVGDPTKRAPGGGATDIRLIKGEPIKLKSDDYYTTYFGDEESLNSRILIAGGGGGNSAECGFAGGEQGCVEQCSMHLKHEKATSGNQTDGGITHNGEPAGLGYGGYTTRPNYGISGGGGGYYGGGGASFGGYGGSGFVNKTYFLSGETISGDKDIPLPNNTQIAEIGHSGYGFAKITFLILKQCTMKKCSTLNWKYFALFCIYQT